MFESFADEETIDGSCEEHAPTQWVVDFATTMHRTKLQFLKDNRDRILASARTDKFNEAAE